MPRILAVLLVSAVFALATFARPSAQDRPLLDRSERAVRVQVSVNFFMSGSTSEANDEAGRVREQARRIVYEMAAKECAVLQSVFANTCRLEAVTVNVNRQMGQPMEGFLINSNMTYSVTVK
jgi:hypothetical protein